ncbi:MAG: aminotransferase class V-fold PLP-dependent enzyme [Oculatellaceae cyanobacterium Prado106]|nr:aminotransferase class V-fold PLP-dependent enzyme [Oculatellaceae cyanobacterium Prado106]
MAWCLYIRVELSDRLNFLFDLKAMKQMMDQPIGVAQVPTRASDSPSPWSSLWGLDPAITFLNHGSFGACPLTVLEKQRSLRSQLESEPVRFFAHELEPLLDAARLELAAFVQADPEGLAFVPNATTGVNTVLRSLCHPAADRSLRPGDELLTTNQEYNACRNALNFAAELSGATIVVAEVPFPIASPEDAIAPLLAKVSSKTRLVLVDHITSQTGLIFPLQSLIQQLTSQGIEVLVDGAHAPGMIPLDLQALGATYYSGNCHKWLSAPKGAGFLAINEQGRSQLRPLTISHGANSPRRDRSRFHLEFDWTGTADPTAYLCVPEAIRYLGSLLPGGWPALMADNHLKALTARQMLCQTLNIEPPCPETMIGSMATLPLPPGSASNLQTALFDRFHIEIPVIPWPTENHRMIRLSAQLYNTAKDYDFLAEALIWLLNQEE